VAISRPGSPLGGWGAKYTERGAEPNADESNYWVAPELAVVAAAVCAPALPLAGL